MTPAALWETVSHFLPITVGVVLVGGAMVGSRLRPEQRKVIERWVLWPVFVALGVSLTVFGALNGDWVKLTAGLVALAIGAIRLLINIRANRAVSPPTDGGGSA